MSQKNINVKIRVEYKWYTSEQDFQTVGRLNPNYPNGFFKLIDLLASVDDVRGDHVGHHEHVVEEEEVLWLNFLTCRFFHP